LRVSVRIATELGLSGARSTRLARIANNRRSRKTDNLVVKLATETEPKNRCPSSCPVRKHRLPSLCRPYRLYAVMPCRVSVAVLTVPLPLWLWLWLGISTHGKNPTGEKIGTAEGV